MIQQRRAPYQRRAAAARGPVRDAVDDRRHPALHEHAPDEREAAGLRRRPELGLLLPVPQHPLHRDHAGIAGRRRPADARRRRGSTARWPSPPPSADRTTAPTSRSTRTSSAASARSDAGSRRRPARRARTCGDSVVTGACRTRCYTPGRAKEPRDRRIAGQGEDDRTLSGRGLPRPRLLRPRARPAREPRQGQVRRRRRPRLRPRVRGQRGQPQARRRHRPRGAQQRHGLPRHRPRPRGRGHRLARRRSGQRPGGQDASRDLQRDHRARHPRGVRPPARHRPEPRRRPAVAAHRRPPRGLHAEPAPVAQGHGRPVRRPCPVGRGPPGRRARARDRCVHGPRVLDDRGDPGDRGRRGVRRRARAHRRRDARRDRRGHRRRPCRGAGRGASGGPQDRGPDPEAIARAAVHDLHPPAGGQPQARPQPEADDVDRAAAVRGRRHAGRPCRAHHLHADRLDGDGRGRHGRGARGHRRALRGAVHDAQGPGLQDQVQGRPGGPRVDPADLLPPRSRIRWPGCSPPTSCACTA